jgi:hypothetical protein
LTLLSDDDVLNDISTNPERGSTETILQDNIIVTMASTEHKIVDKIHIMV